MMEKSLNAYQQIKRREYGIRQSSRSKFNILKRLLLDENYVYKDVWTKYSNKDIRTEGGRLYFENYTKCYGGYGKGNKPVYLHSISTPQDQKIETALEASIQPETLSLPCKGERPSFYCIVGKCWLMRYDLFSGNLLEEVYLSPRSHCQFKDLSWNEPGCSIVVKSTHKLSGCVRLVESGHPTVVKVLALFDVFPLKFTGMFEITKTVFGKDTVDAMASCGFLTTMHTSGLVKLHSMEYVLQEYMQYEAELYTELPDQNEICGNQPFGLPLNIIIKEEPPVLFQVHCHQSSLEVGGYPWHYMYTPKRKDGSFHVKSLSSGQLADNGILHSKTLGMEEDRAMFCTDESGRILHIDSNSVSVYRIQEKNVTECMIEKCFTIDLKKEEQGRPIPYDNYSSSGRHIRSIAFGSMLLMDFELPNMCIHNVDYICVLVYT
ncbi:DDB1- and CUL4-associated factor 17-like isoform X2 [Ostrea edulis]|uniref:DDB1- and CUL4-associated factor 17-like isoform X2 n=1 Tax=Ostrea edulis TaxID=37623 RepID=UPI0024AF5972|nr:DDB1- and CUL4-associated factor 17-like isoform X2 [Ostrea edulis]